MTVLLDFDDILDSGSDRFSICLDHTFFILILFPWIPGCQH
ncbi:hypothetical protein HOLDEFILI_03031 [Holdemania filiformis DSM 12042]|uniref:Uncharacterized protein n=1 Tax=Holdemania filiformis DSM 12042 TaxID=545696 RepID=B9YB24_9FIRM|nr:hypothetical protein HOLDEFILI_03031 [Holdemania filiformis DSM 12042]